MRKVRFPFPKCFIGRLRKSFGWWSVPKIHGGFGEFWPQSLRQFCVNEHRTYYIDNRAIGSFYFTHLMMSVWNPCFLSNAVFWQHWLEEFSLKLFSPISALEDDLLAYLSFNLTNQGITPIYQYFVRFSVSRLQPFVGCGFVDNKDIVPFTFQFFWLVRSPVVIKKTF